MDVKIWWMRELQPWPGEQRKLLVYFDLMEGDEVRDRRGIKRMIFHPRDPRGEAGTIEDAR